MPGRRSARPALLEANAGQGQSSHRHDGPGLLDAFADLIAGRPTPLASFTEAAGAAAEVGALLADGAA